MGPEEWKKPWYIINSVKKCTWYYEDNYCSKHVKNGTNNIYKHWGYDKPGIIRMVKYLLLHHPELGIITDAESAYNTYENAMKKILRCGAILVDESTFELLLVQSAQSRHFSFPRGKVNKNETAIDCMYRELEEEVGLNLRDYKMEPLGVLKTSVSDTNSCFFVFLGKFKQLQLKICIPTEISAYLWVPFNKLGRVNTFCVQSLIPKLEKLLRDTMEKKKKKKKKYQSLCPRTLGKVGVIAVLECVD